MPDPRPCSSARRAAFGARPGDYERIAMEIGIRASLMATVVSRLRRRFREWVRTEIAATVATPAEVDVELSYLVELMAS